MRIRFTLPILVIALTASFLFLAAINIQGGWLYLVDAFLWSLVLIAAVVPFLQLRTLNAQRRLPGEIYTHQNIPLTLEVSHQGRWPTSFLSIQDCPPQRLFRPAETLVLPENAKGFVVSLRANETFSYTYPLSVPEAGVYCFEAIESGSFGPLGLIGIYRRKTVRTALVVRPTQPEGTLQQLLRQGEEAHEVLQQERQQMDMLNVSHFRNYQPGDNRRMIHWKNTARRNQLTVAESRSEPLRKIHLVMDTTQHQTPALIAQSQTLAAVLIRDYLHQDYTLQCSAQPPASGTWEKAVGWAPTRIMPLVGSWSEASFWLATLEADSEQSLENWLPLALQGQGEADKLIVISAHPTPTLLRQLEEHGQYTGRRCTLYLTAGNAPSSPYLEVVSAL
jgi:uncharacterized protein (DUF58 family)